MHKHIGDVVNDRTLIDTDIFACAETRLVKLDDFTIDVFKVYRNDDCSSSSKYVRPFNEMVLAYHDKDLVGEPKSCNQLGVEIIFIHVKFLTYCIDILTVYKPPKINNRSLFAALDMAFRSISLDGMIGVLGDF